MHAAENPVGLAGTAAPDHQHMSLGGNGGFRLIELDLELAQTAAERMGAALHPAHGHQCPANDGENASRRDKCVLVFGQYVA